MTSPATPDPLTVFEPLGDATGFVDRILEIIEHINLFGDLERDEIGALARYMKCFRTPPGVEIIHEGEHGDFMLLLLNGTVEIVKTDHQGLPRRLALAGPGKTLGEMSLIDGEPRFASCISLETIDFAVLTRDGLVEFLSEEPRTGVKFLMELLMLFNQRLRTVSSDLMKCLENQRLRIR